MKIHDLKLQIFPFAVSTLLSAWTALKFHKRTSDEEYIIISIETQKTTYLPTNLLLNRVRGKFSRIQYFVVRIRFDFPRLQKGFGPIVQQIRN